MNKQELIERIKNTTSTVDFYNMKHDILKILEDNTENKNQKNKKGDE